MLILRSPGFSACRDCAQSGFGGPGENRFTAYDPLCRGAACRDTGFPQVFVNASNLTLFVRVTDLVFGGPAPALTLEHSFNMDDTRGGVLGIGWAFSLGDSITTDPDGTLVLRRGSGRTDRFATAAGSTALFPITSTTDTLARAADGTYTLRTAASSTTRTFSADGRLLSILDGATVRVALDYDSSSHLSAAHYRGNLINFATDSTGRITSIKDAAGRSVSFTYTADGRLAQQTNADGQTVAWQYDANGNLTSLTWAGGKTAIAYTGDPGFLAVASVTTPDGAVRQYDTPRAPEEIRVTDGNGDATWYTSSALGLLQTVVDSAGNTITYTYDASGNRIRAVNGAGEAVSFTYDSSNNLTGITDAANNRWTATYSTGTDAHHRPQQERLDPDLRQQRQPGRRHQPRQLHRTCHAQCRRTDSLARRPQGQQAQLPVQRRWLAHRLHRRARQPVGLCLRWRRAHFLPHRSRGRYDSGCVYPRQSHRPFDRGEVPSNRSTTPASSATASTASPTTPIPTATS